MGQVIHCGGAARDPKIHNLFQIADVDSGVIRCVNADLVTQIPRPIKTQLWAGHDGCEVVLSGDRWRLLNAPCFSLSGFVLLSAPI